VHKPERPQRLLIALVLQAHHLQERRVLFVAVVLHRYGACGEWRQGGGVGADGSAGEWGEGVCG
jgi:hypothetical protein